MRAKRLLLVVAVVVGSLATVQPARADGVRYVDEVFTQVEVTRDIKFGEATNSRGELEQLLLDLYEPGGDSATDRGLLVWAHGSGFRYGEKEDNGPVEEYAKLGWVAVSIGYRKRPELPPNAAIGILTNPESVTVAQAAARDAQHDMQAAVRWARAHAAELGVDPDRIAVGGISAGGIIALMTAFNPTDPGDSGTPGVSSEVAAAVSHAGAYAPVLQGGLPSPGAPPVAMYHGTSDEQVPYPTSPPGCVLTILMGNSCEYVTFVGREHTTLGVDLAQDFLYRNVILDEDHLRSANSANVDDEVTVVGGAEHVLRGVGATTGVVIPTDPNVLVEKGADFVRYVLEALGIPVPAFG